MTGYREPLAGTDREVVHGREAEQKVIRDLLRRTQQGAGGLVLVDGEPGSGKSQLLRDATDEAAEQGFSLAVGAADQLSQAIPFSALRAALREPFAWLTDDEPGRDRPDAAAWWITKTRARLEQRAAVAPVLVCLDDLNWASLATLAALQALPRDLKRLPVAWLLARSSTSQCPAEFLFDQLEKEDGAVRVTLAPLDEDSVVAMLTDAFGAHPDQALMDLTRGAAGNPSLVAELVGGLRDDHAVHVAGGRAVLTSARLPQRIHRLAQRRLDGLSDQARQLLVTAAVLGPAFRLEDAAEMLGQTPATLLPPLDEAMDAAILTVAEHSFTFRHQLLRRTVGEMIPPPARRALERQYGELLLDRGGSAARAASHLLQAAQAGDPASLAGLDRAAAQTLPSAPQAAADLTLRALELTSAADPAALPRAVAAVEALTAAGRLNEAAPISRDLLAQPLPASSEDRLRCALSSALSAAGHPRDALGQAQLVLARPQPGDLRDRALIAQLQALAGLRDELAGPTADVILDSPSRHGSQAAAAALVVRSIVSWDGGQLGDSLKLLREAARRGAGTSPDARHVQPLLALAAALVDLRQLAEAEDLLRRADHQALPDVPAAVALSVLRARVHLAAGRLADAVADAQTALAIARALGAHGYAAIAHSVLSVIELRRGDLKAAAHHLAARPAVGPQFADLYARSETIAAEAQLTEARDGAAAALGHLRQLWADLPARFRLVLGDPVMPAWLARTALAAGDIDVAVGAARTARTLADGHPGYPALAAAAAHSQGLVHRDPARLAEAAARHPDPWARASAAEDLGVLYCGRADREQGVHRLREALGGYRQVGAERDQARVRRRLRTLGVRSRHWSTPPDRPVTGWRSLTDTEQAVAGLVAEGLSNSQVAERMYISSNTVAHHLRRAFRKLSVGSRYELTRIVIEQAQPGGIQRSAISSSPSSSIAPSAKPSVRL